MKTTDIITGCSSYYNFRWAEIFYPAGIGRHKWFEYYCEHFNTYEINGSFYKFPTVKSLQTWYNKSPEGFLFSLKVPKLITHIKRLEDCERELSEFYTACREGLADKLACVLFQLPPSFSYTPERLELVLKAADPAFTNVVEFRNESWWTQEVFEALAATNISFCSVNYPKLPTAVTATTDLVYVRFHGNPRLFYSEYTAEELKRTYDEILATKCSRSFVYFNNTASTAAILNAVAFKKLAGSADS